MNTNDSSREVFSGRLRDARKAMGLTQTEFGVKCGIARGSVTYYERQEQDKIRLPDSETLRRICLTTGLSADYFLGLTDEPKEFDLNISKVCRHLGLSREAVDWLHENESDPNETNRIIDLLIKCANRTGTFYELLRSIELYCIVSSSLPTTTQLSELTPEAQAEYAYCAQKIKGLGYFPVKADEYLKTIFNSTVLRDFEAVIGDVLNLYTTERVDEDNS